jgi:Pyruvate/2-oxoacid:ferredoxin oxidoreductase gamma subunit
LLVNTSLIDITSGRTDIVELGVPANEIALECGAGKAANMAVLGAYVGYSGAVEPSSIEELVRNHFERKPKLVDINMKVLERGLALGRDAATTRKRSA